MNSFWLFVIIVAAILLSAGYIRAFFKRIIMYFKLKRCCKQNGCKIETVNSIFLPNRSARTSLKITQENYVYLVKLFGSAHRLETYYISETDYRTQRVIPLGAGRGGFISYTKESKPKPFPDIDWFGDTSPDASKTYIPIILFCPAPMELRIINGRTNDESKPLLGSNPIVDAYMKSVAKRKFNDGRNTLGPSAYSGGYTYLLNTVRKFGGEYINGSYIFSTKDFMSAIKNGPKFY